MLLSLLTACGGDDNQTTIKEQTTNSNPNTIPNNKQPTNSNDHQLANNDSADTMNIPTKEIEPTSDNITPVRKKEEIEPSPEPNVTEEIIPEPEPEEKTDEIQAPKPEPVIIEPSPEPAPSPRKPQKPSLSHDIFDELLQKYVNSSGRVDYNAMKKEQQQLAEYIMVLQNNPPQRSWSKDKEMAYWINLYNAFTIQSILQRYPVSSIMDLHGGNIWDKATIQIGGRAYTLNQIEKEVLLKGFKEPRVHFAVNCAAASCPPLLNRAWTASNIQGNFEKSAKAFINNPKYNKLSAQSAKISKIFEWYANDFGGRSNIINYLNKYSTTKIKSNTTVEYLEYDWKLNKQ